MDLPSAEELEQQAEPTEWPDRPDPEWPASKTLEFLKHKFAAEAAMIDGFLLTVGWIKKGEGLPSMKASMIKHACTNWEQFMRNYAGYKVNRQKKAAGK